MEKENMKKTSADRERRKKLTNAILMAFVCIMMMSGATYAWFTMSNTAKVNSMKLNVAAEGTLYIYTDNSVATQKVSEVSWPDMTDAKTLYPCTSAEGIYMFKPIYGSEKEVTSTEQVAEAEKNLYYLQQDFYLYMDEGTGATPKTYNVSLVQNDASNTGTYFSSSASIPKPEYCVRMSFEVDGQNLAVYEPNSNGTNGGSAGTDYATNSIVTPAVTSTHQQNTDGKFISTAGNAADRAPVTGDSDKLFTITGNTATKVTVRVWFEGTDTDCQNNINTKEIVGQLKFVANKTTPTQNP